MVQIKVRGVWGDAGDVMHETWSVLRVACSVGQHGGWSKKARNFTVSLPKWEVFIKTKPLESFRRL
jgi:hypothetical protein